MASFFSKPMLLLSFSTCVFHVFFGCPRFLLPFTSNSNSFLRTCPSSLLNTCPYHLTPFAFAIWTTVSFNPNISIRSSVLFFSMSFAPHIALTIALSVLLISKLLSHFPSDTMSHSHITSPLLENSDKPFPSPSARTFFSSATLHIPWTSPSQFLLLLSQLPCSHHLHSPYPPNNRNLSPFPPLHTTPPPVPLIHQVRDNYFKKNWNEVLKMNTCIREDQRTNGRRLCHPINGTHMFWAPKQSLKSIS